MNMPLSRPPTRTSTCSRTGEPMTLFFYDVPKVMMHLSLIIFAIGVVRSFFSPKRTRVLLAGKREGVGNVMAASLGVVTPFSSCSRFRCSWVLFGPACPWA